MALYDEYQQYRNARFNEQEKKLIDGAMYHDELRPAELIEVPGGYYHKYGDRFASFQVSALVKAHMEIAWDRAKAQFKDLPIMPEDEDISLRYPGVDPVGKFSIIDMKLAQREAVIRARLESMSGPVKEAITTLLDNVRGEGGGAPFTYEGNRMRDIVEKHRILTRASKLCLDPFGRQLLHQQARELETCKDVVERDQDLQLLEYACGLRRGPVPQELIEREKTSRMLSFPMNEALADKSMDQIIAMGQSVDLADPPKEIHLEFQNLEHKALQRAFSDPANWGKSLEQLQEVADWLMGPDQPDSITPYARATADRVLNGLFVEAEQNTGKTVSRGDLIIIDGQTVRERMLADYTKAGNSASEFNNFYEKNVNRLTSEYVAAGLMAGKRVETFIPDGTGRISNEPTQIIKTGYEPSPLKPEHFNAWQRFFSRHGFYKEKVARQAEYERMMAARQRVRLKGLGAQVNHFSTAHNKELFFGPILEEMGFVKETADGQRKYDWDRMASHMMSDVRSASVFNQFTRSEPIDTCVCYLAAQGHKFRDIMDPTKLQDERLAAARLFLEKAQTNDTEWLGEVFYKGHNALIGQVRELTDGVDLRDINALTEVIPEAEGLIHSAFSVSQNLKDGGCTLGYHKAALAEVGGDLALASQKANALNDTVNNVSLFAGDMLSGVKALAVLADPSARLPGAAMAPDLGTMRLALDHMRKGPSIVEKACTFGEMIGFRAASSTAIALTEAVDQLTATPAARAGVAEAAVSGRLIEELQVKKFTSEPYKGPDGKPLQNTEQQKVLRLGEDGKYAIAVVESPHTVNNPVVEFKLGEAFTPKVEQAAPQMQVAQRQRAPQRQQQPPQMGGPHR